MAPGSAGPIGINLDRLYAEELPFVYSFLYRLGGRSADLEDLAHDVFVTAVRRWDSYDASRPVRPWLLGIAFRVAADFRRKPGRDREADGALADIPDEGRGAEAHVQQREARELVDEALESLAPERRAVFVMHQLEGISAPDIAAAMGSPLATTYSRLRIGREEFTAAVRRIQLRRGES